MNSIPSFAHWEADAILNWFDDSPDLRVAIITGAGEKAFCAGQDLIEQAKFKIDPPPMSTRRHPPSGFCGISRRVGKKPVIAAVNGDLVVASPLATFGLPEAAVGLYAAAGGLPRIVRNCGLQIATEIALTNRKLTAKEALSYNLINRVAQSPETVLKETLSPDAVIVSRAGLREAWETGSVERATQIVAQRYDQQLFEGENMRIGLEAFAGKKKPLWVPSKI
ncbi:enoyl-hydratase [Botrytis cinerea]